MKERTVYTCEACGWETDYSSNIYTRPVCSDEICFELDHMTTTTGTITRLKRNGIFQVCPDKNTFCSNCCPFFDFDGDKKLNLLCRPAKITILIEGGD